MSRHGHGLRAWIWQRVSALYMAVYLPLLVAVLWWSPPAGWHDWQALMANTAVNLATGLFTIALLVHAWVGARDVVIDYVHATGLRLGLLALIVLILAGSGVWAFAVLYSLQHAGFAS